MGWELAPDLPELAAARVGSWRVGGQLHHRIGEALGGQVGLQLGGDLVPGSGASSASSRTSKVEGPVWISWQRRTPGVSSTTVTRASGPGTRRWPVERTHAWGNQYGKLRWCTERRRIVVQFWLALAAAAIVCGQLVRRAWTNCCWVGRPGRRP